MKFTKIFLFALSFFIMGVFSVSATSVTGSTTVIVESVVAVDLCPLDPEIQTTLPCPSDFGTSSLNGSDCEIGPNKGTCLTDLTLYIENPVNGAATNITKSVPAFNTVVATGITPSKKIGIPVTYPSTTFYLNHKGSPLAIKTINATCKAGTTWEVKIKNCVPNTENGYWKQNCGACDQNSCKEQCTWQCVAPINGGTPCPSVPVPANFSQSCTAGSCGGGNLLGIVFYPSPTKVFKNKSSVLTWSTNSASNKCKAVTTGFGMFTTGAGDPENGNAPTAALTKTTIYEIECRNKDSSIIETKQAIVKVNTMIIIEK